eukprot:GHVR01165883.1.p1 GENE.GHVR01165883.1~~GHVR01165883.1.p1  ORF type:complete len:491 (+),score=130.17 GHVR01165883.1:16-1488(+)
MSDSIFPNDFPNPYLTYPTESNSKDDEVRITRQCATFEDLSSIFEIEKKTFTQQYAHIYTVRLQLLRGVVSKSARAAWPDIRNEYHLDELKELAVNVECCVIGVLYKAMKLKPSVLADYSKKLSLQGPLSSYVSDDDSLYLEDNSNRVQLTMGGSLINTQHKLLVTGLVVGLRGYLRDTGLFEVHAHTLPGAGIPPPLKPHTLKKYVGFISGLNLGSPSTPIEPLVMLRDFFLGSCGDVELSASIVHLIVGGNSFGNSTVSDKAMKSRSRLQPADRFAHEAAANETAALEEADIFFSHLAASVPVHVMTGPDDPTSKMLPLPPLHPSLLPTVATNKNFTGATNPIKFKLDGVEFMGTSGESVGDILSVSSIDTPLDALKLIAEARCLAPTAPDTLPCYPYTSSDPFCFPESVPNVLFSCNHDGFGSYRYQNNGPLCVCVPRYSHCPTLTLVSLDCELHVKTIKFENIEDIHTHTHTHTHVDDSNDTVMRD